jgi:hypothetical protein
MDFNLSALQKAVNQKFVEPENEPVEFHLTDDSTIKAKFGNVVYFFTYQKLEVVLYFNGFTHYYKEDTQEQLTELLSRHIMNQINAGRGKKLYPEIKSAPGDLI